MKLLDVVREVRRHLEENGRVSLRMLRRQYELDDEALDELIEELVDVQRVARREENVLVWAGPARPEPVAATPSAPQRNTRPQAQPADGAAHTGAARHTGQVETRKVISIIFADLMGSTALQERLDPESVNRVMDAYYQAVRDPVEAAGGTVVQLLGDGVLCAFGIPTIAEDDALRAVRAAAGIQQAFREFLGTQQWLSVPIGLRVAVNTGEVVVSDEHPAGIGDPLNVAARLQQEARDGEVLIGQTTRRLVADAVTLEQAGVFALKGRAETVTAYRVMSLERPTGAAATAFVGRADELARMTAVYEATVSTPAARVAVLLGSPGLGKSRLIEEFIGRQGESVSVLTAHCDAAGGATFAPLAAAFGELLSREGSARAPLPIKEGSGAVVAADRLLPNPLLGKEGRSETEVLRAAIDAVLPTDASDRTRIAAGIAALLAGSPASPEETFFVIRRFLAALAQQTPVVLVIDDLQWAEPLLLDLVEHLVQWGGGVPLLLLVGARPELRNVRSSLVTPGPLVADVVTLAGLDAGAAMRLAANVIGAADLPAAVAAKVLATSEGNPLFVGELVRMLVDEGALTKEGDRWVTGLALASMEMPPTIHALLAARIERLRPEERSVLERAAVVGRLFSRSAVAALLSHNGTSLRAEAVGEASELDARLEALRRGELIEPDSGWFLGEPMLRFHHVLIRDAAYRRLLKGTRAELHARFADWVAARAGEAEYDETIGWHLEQAHQLLRELGPLDSAGRTLGERAARHLAAAGRRALGRDDLPVAADLLGRAIDRLDVDDASRADLALDWCEALLAAGDVGRAGKAVDELGRFIGDQPDQQSPTRSQKPETRDRLQAWHTCFAGQLTALTAPQDLQAAADAVAAAAQQLAALGDAAGEAKAHSVHATALARLGKVGACEAALDQALAAARRGGDRRRANAVLAGAPLAALWGPSPVTRASGRCLDVVRVLRITQGAPAVESVALSCQGVLEALRGRTEAARRMLASSRKMVEDLGIAHRLFEADAFAGRIAAMEGDDATAERLLRGAYLGLRDLGLGIDAARAGALLGRTLLAQDRIAEAEAISHESEALAGDDLQAAIAWRGVRAEAMAKRGEHAAAVELAKAAVAIAAATDALLDHADARVALAVALRAAGRAAEADAEGRRAIELWEAKGATLLAERALRDDGRADVREAGALAHVAALPVPSATLARRVRPNAATEQVRRLDVAMRTGDGSGIRALYTEDLVFEQHFNAAEQGQREIIDGLTGLVARQLGLTFRHEPLATLGDALALARVHIGSAGSAPSAEIPAGALEVEWSVLIEATPDSRAARVEMFDERQLGKALARLYERHSELLPDGPERERATATARSFGVTLTAPSDVDGYATVIAPDFESVDHRYLSTWSLRGDGAFLAHNRALQEVAADVVIGTHDVLALRPGALLIQRMHSGTARLGGGAYERPFLVLFATDADGRLARAEWFDSDREAEALARFEEIVASAAPKLSVRRRVRANAATAMQAPFDAALATRDFEAIAALFHENHQEIDHPTGSTYGRDACTASLQRLFRSRDPYYQVEPLATLGEFLLLVRRRSGAAGATSARYDVGAYANEAIQLFEVDASGRCRRAEVFATDHLGEAIARLYERYAELLPDGPERIRAEATAGTIAVWNGSIDPDRVAATTAPLIECVDRRSLQLWSARGADEFLGQWRGQLDLATGSVRHDDVLALEPDTLLVRQTYFGNERTTGGFFDHLLLVLFAFGADGLLTRAELWEPDREAEALARFEELAAPAAYSQSRFANAATGTAGPVIACMVAHDWQRFEQLFAQDFRMSDRRRVVQLELDRDQYVVFTREVANGRTLRGDSQVLATRGDRLALNRSTFVFMDTDVGPSEIAFLILTEVDARGRIVAYVRWDLGDLDAACAELDARWQAGEAAAHPRASKWLADYLRFFAARDWNAMSTLFVPELVGENHRLVGWGTLYGPAAVVSTLQAQIELAPDTQERVDHVRTCADAVLLEYAWHGTHAGGAFENLWLVLIELDADGRGRCADVWEVEQLDQALARFAELAGREAEPAPDGGAFEKPMFVVFEVDDQGRSARSDTYDIEDRDGALAHLAELAAPTSAEPHFENAASRAWREVIAVWRQRDGERFAALHPTALLYRDHRRLVQLDLDRDEFLAFTRPLLEMRSNSASNDLLATRGERLALMRSTLEMADDSVGPSAIDSLLLIETGERGAIVAYDRYEIDDQEAARAEIEARWEAGEGSQFPTVAWMRDHSALAGRRDWDAVAALYSPAVVGHDHRLVGWGTLRGRTDFLQSLRSMEALSPDARIRGDHIRACARGSIMSSMWVGTRDGGAFESPFLVVSEVDPDGKVVRIDFYDPHHFDRARARFEEIAAEPNRPAPFPAREGVGRDPLAALAKPNSATVFLERAWAAFDLVDLEAAKEALATAREHFSPDFVWEDRRRIVGLSGGLDLMLASARERLASGARHQRRTIVGTAGDRVAIGRILWAGGPPDGRFEVEFLAVHEVNEAGLCTALIFFDPDDMRAAQREAWARWAAIDPVAAPWVELLTEITDAWNSHDRPRLRARYADDVVIEDHRHAGLGRIEGADAYLDSNVALWELAPDQRLEVGWSWPAVDRHGFVVTIRREGTVPDGGPFESEYLLLGLARNGRSTRAEFFEIDALDTALARFEELRPPSLFELRRTSPGLVLRSPAKEDPLRIPPNAATRARAQWARAVGARDWEGVRGLVRADFVFEDRGKRALVKGDVETWIASAEFTTSLPGVRIETPLIGTFGERISIDQIFWSGAPEGGAFEFERIRVLEIDEEGRFRRAILFDPDDRPAAFDEAHARFVAAEGAAGGQAPIAALFRAAGLGDWETVRASLAPDLAYHDHRNLGLGTFGRDAWVESLRALSDLADEMHVEAFCTLAWNGHGHVARTRQFGTVAGGGPFENVFIVVWLTDGDRIFIVEVFDLDDAERAVARFNELCAAAAAEETA